MKERICNFKDLDIWNTGMKIVKEIYEITNTYPRSEMYELTIQMRRAAISIPSNIAEGFNRFHNKEYKQFLFISLGSCAELETQIEVALILNYIGKQKKENLAEEIDYESRMLRNLIKKLT